MARIRVVSSENEKVIEISDSYKKLHEAEQLLIERVQLLRRRDLSDAEVVRLEVMLNMKELGWAKRWGILN
ncbi:hypothetical protein [Oceanospirillum beijerinckii]|uniref:hypothetical protein n=1 Tax=Oceanospirillum beijerinckii TaxID=64976 RepID=UPI000406305D|nr:hypothetical protein [Oceanospirillum beijerinckii]